MSRIIIGLLILRRIEKTVKIFLNFGELIQRKNLILEEVIFSFTKHENLLICIFLMEKDN